MPDWWNSFTKNQQKEYLKEHPGSKLKLAAYKTDTPAHQQHHSPEHSPSEDKPIGKKPDPATLSKTLKYSQDNGDKFAAAAEPTLDNMKKNFDSRVDDMSTHQRRKLVREIKTAFKLKDRGRIRKATKKVSILTGILSIGAVGLSLATGMDMTLAVEVLATGFMDDILNYANRKEDEIQDRSHQKQMTKQERREAREEQRHQDEIEEEIRKDQAEAVAKRKAQRAKEEDDADELKNIGKAFVDKVKENLSNPEEVNKAIRESDSPDVMVDDTEKSEAANIVITSSHETDLTKAIIKIEKLEIASQTETILNSSVDDGADTASNTVHKLLRHIEVIESTIPSIASIFVTSISQRSSLSNRARSQLQIYNRELARCRAELANFGSRNSKNFKKTPLGIMLKKNIKSAGYKYEISYVKCENSNIRMCELHTFRNADVAGVSINKVEVYSYMDNNDLNVALLQDSNFTPKAFTSIRPRNLASWLIENGVSA